MATVLSPDDISTNGHSGGATLALRPYQHEALMAIKASPHKRQVLALACGLGKTIVFSHLIAEMAAYGKRCLVLVHTDELVQQTLEKLALVAPGLSVGIVKAACDEMVLGVTATPERGDVVGLHAVFEGVVYRKDILSGIEDGYLCDLRGLQVQLAADLDRVHTMGGDFVEGELAQELERADIPACMVQAYCEHTPARKALAYLPSVALAERTTQLFREASIPAGVVSGKTPLEERRQILAQLRASHVRVVANCMVLVEGFDEPSAGAILLGRPTQSRTLYIQIAGRGARLHPGKDDCVIVDFVAATSRHDLVTLGDLFGLPLRLLNGRTVTGALAEQEREEEERSAAEQRRLATRDVEVLRRPASAPRRPLHWAREGAIYALPLPTMYERRRAGVSLSDLRRDTGSAAF
jgi:superfamily II DNA or RNA helicase